VRVGVHFGAAVFEMAADFRERRARGLGIAGRHSLRCALERRADTVGVRMQDEDGENIAENHSGQD
jgi:hypothetical protein